MGSKRYLAEIPPTGGGYLLHIWEYRKLEPDAYWARLIPLCRKPQSRSVNAIWYEGPGRLERLCPAGTENMFRGYSHPCNDCARRWAVLK